MEIQSAVTFSGSLNVIIQYNMHNTYDPKHSPHRGLDSGQPFYFQL